MGEDEHVISSGQVITPETVHEQAFTSAFRGYHPVEVRQFLKRVGDELAAGAGREVELRRALQDALNRAAHPDLDETTVTTVLGEHAARLISSARETAASITGEATTRADALLRDADGRVARMRDEAEGLLARRLAEADAAVASIMQAAGADAQRVIEEATQRGKEMVAEARDVRERMLADLAKRRKAAQTQLEQLRAARDRLLAAYDVVRRTLDEATDELEAAEPAARAAAEAVRLGDPPRRRVSPVATEKPLAVVAAPALRPQTVAASVARHTPDVAAASPAAPSELATGEVPAVTPDTPPPTNGNGHSNGNGNGNGNGHAGPPPPAEAKVDDLFARIRADRAAAVPDPPAPAPAAALDPVAAENALAGRDDVLENIEAGLARALKRVLQDEQNEALDRLRRAGRPDGDAVLPDTGQQRNAYRVAALPWLQQAARAGVGFVSEAEHSVPSLEAQAETLATDLVGPLGDRLAGAMDADDAEAAGEGMRAVYRQWKVQQVAEAARHHVATAFAVGAFAATAAGAAVQWLVEDDGHCPDCDDNALAGPTPKGQPFPTGQLHPPAHPGCRCLLVPAPA